jgi:hypothetical protein
MYFKDWGKKKRAAFKIAKLCKEDTVRMRSQILKSG